MFYMLQQGSYLAGIRTEQELEKEIPPGYFKECQESKERTKVLVGERGNAPNHYATKISLEHYQAFKHLYGIKRELTLQRAAIEMKEKDLQKHMSRLQAQGTMPPAEILT